MRKWQLAVLLLLIIMIFTACGKEDQETAATPDQTDITNEQQQEPVTEPEPKETDTEEQEPVSEGKEYPYYAPLTGIGSDIEINNRITMVMVGNNPEARPQSGLNKADIVYEVLAEGNITRFAAFFQSEYPENVGPVRSIRPYYIEIGNGYDAVLVHAGGSPEAFSIIAKKGLPSINQVLGGMEPYFWRAKFRKAPHNLYTDFNKIQDAAKALKFRENSTIPTFTFLKSGEEVEGDQASEINVKYYSGYQVGYSYDAEKRVYLRSINKESHTDLITGEQLSTTNLLIVETKHRVLDSEGRLAVDITSGGEGYLFQLGKVQKISWKNTDGVIRAYKDGKEVPLAPGKTWINIIPNVNAEVTYK